MIHAVARYGIRTLLPVLLVLANLLPATAQQGTSYTIAVIPSAPPVATNTLWTPLVERLSRETGHAFRLKVFDTMAKFEQEIWGGSPDFIFASPIQTVVAHERHRYIPLVRGANPIAIRLFVRNDSSVKTVGDLSGKRIAFVGNKNLCSVFMRHMLAKQKDKLSYMTEYSGSTKNVIKSVLLGKSDAGAVFASELERETRESRELTRALLDTPKVAPHPLSAHPRVPREMRNRVKKAIESIAGTRDGAELLKAVRLASPVSADYERDYKVLEDVNVIGLTDWGN
jgi:phosphonate transport system substrate-binding protein